MNVKGRPNWNYNFYYRIAARGGRSCSTALYLSTVCIVPYKLLYLTVRYIPVVADDKTVRHIHGRVDACGRKLE